MKETEQKTVWLIDPVHSRIRFETKYLLITSISGWFTQFEGSVKTNSDNFSDSEIELTVCAERFMVRITAMSIRYIFLISKCWFRFF